MDINNYAIVGAGGIGHYFTPMFVKYLAFHKPGSKVSIIDGDEIEDKNLSRCYADDDIGELKAEVLADTCNRIIPDGSLDIQFIPEFFTPSTFDRYHRSWCKDELIMFGCVDNNKSRVYMEEKIGELKTGALISGGNSYHEGQSQMYVRIDGVDITPPITTFAPEIRDESEPHNIFPGEEDCSQEYESEPQLILANITAAVAMLNMYYSQLVDQTPRADSINECVFNIVDGGSIVPFKRKSLPVPQNQPS